MTADLLDRGRSSLRRTGVILAGSLFTGALVWRFGWAWAAFPVVTTLVLMRRNHALTIRCRNAEAQLGLSAKDLEAAEQRLQIAAHDRDQSTRHAESSEALYRQIVDTASEGIWVVGADGLTSYVNQCLADMLGYERDELMRRPLWDFLSDGGRAEALRLGQLSVQTLPTRVEASFKRRDGDTLWALVSTSEICDRSGVVIGTLGMMADVTERRRVAEELVAAKQTAEAANEAKSTFLATISHEIRTPLSAILGFTDLMMEDVLGEDQRASFMATIHRNAKALSRLINDVLDLSKVEAGRLEVELAPMRVQDLAQDLVVLFDETAKAKDVDLTVSIDTACPESVQTDSTRLRQILINLVGNALKFTSAGHIAIHFTHRNFDDCASRLSVTVSDTGAGIEIDAQRRLFASFSQADHTIARRYGGTGLGLALSRKLARALGGDVVLVDSAPGRGSIFEVTVETSTPDPLMVSLFTSDPVQASP